MQAATRKSPTELSPLPRARAALKETLRGTTPSPPRLPPRRALSATQSSPRRTPKQVNKLASRKSSLQRNCNSRPLLTRVKGSGQWTRPKGICLKHSIWLWCLKVLEVSKIRWETMLSNRSDIIATNKAIEIVIVSRIFTNSSNKHGLMNRYCRSRIQTNLIRCRLVRWGLLWLARNKTWMPWEALWLIHILQMTMMDTWTEGSQTSWWTFREDNRWSTVRIWTQIRTCIQDKTRPPKTNTW